MAVVLRDAGVDRRNEFIDAFEDAAADALGRDFREPALDLIEPRTAGGGKMQMVTRSLFQPGGDLRGFVRGVVIQHQVDVEAGRHCLLDLIKEAHKFLLTMPALAPTDDPTRGCLQSGKQGSRAMPIVIMSAPLRLAWTHRQDRLTAIECLHLALLIDAEHHRTRLLWRVEIKANNVTHFLDKEGIARELEVFLQMRLQTEGVPDTHDGVLVQPAGFCHRARAPMRGVFGTLFQSARNDLFDFGVGNFARLARAGQISQSVETSGPEAFPPGSHGLRGDMESLRHGLIARPGGASKDDPRSQSAALTGFRTPRYEFQLHSIVFAQQ